MDHIPEPEDKSPAKAAHALWIAALVLVCTVVFSRPVLDPDLWYHLASGRYIVENRALIKHDPFTYTTYKYQEPGDLAFLDNLKGYWLAQSAMYLTWAVLGLWGIFALRVALFALMYITAWESARREGAERHITFMLIALTSVFLTYFTGERPQLFSFLFAPLLLLLLERFRSKRSNSGIWIVILMALWANMHRGFPMGSAIMVVFLTGEFIDLRIFKRPQSTDDGYLGRLSMVVALGVLATLLNPGGYDTYIAMFRFEGSRLQAGISEYWSIPEAAGYGYRTWPYWTYSAIALISLAARGKNSRAAHVLILVGLFVASARTIRYSPFFMLTTLPYTAANFTRIIGRVKSLDRPAKVVAPVIAGTLILYVTLVMYPGEIGRLASGPLRDGVFPEGASEFLRESAPSRRVFNHMTWGGYLAWRLYPPMQVFYDTRTLNVRAYDDYMQILFATPAGAALLDEYGIDTVIIPALNQNTGLMYGLFEYMVRDEGWVLAYSDTAAVVFERTRGEGTSVASGLPKTTAWLHLIEAAKRIKLTESTALNLGPALLMARDELEQAGLGQTPIGK